MMRPQGCIVTMALWLLNRVGDPQRSTELTGDIVEEYQRGRSALWFSTQAFATVAFSAWHQIRSQKLFVLSGMVCGLTSLWCVAAVASLVLASVGFPHAVQWRWPHRLELLTIGFAYTVVSGWIVARVHRTYRVAAVFGFLASVVLSPAIELPLIYWVAPSVFFVTVLPLLPVALTATYIGAPIAILMGGFWDPPVHRSHLAR